MSLIEQLRDVTPPGQVSLDPAAVARLTKITRQLIAERHDEAAAEHARYLAVGKRELCLPADWLNDRLRGAVVLVTGGTGCIGSALIEQLAPFGPARIVSASRGLTQGYPRYDGTEYVTADIRNAWEMYQLVRRIRPDVIFHVAGQRDPGLAEIQVQRTVAANVFGTYNVLAAAQAGSVQQMVLASTGKAVRLFCPEIYAASKRAAEWLAADASDAVPVSAVRFTHVVDNSLVYQQLGTREVTRLHSPDIMFYVQSATEAAQLLLLASLDTSPEHLPVRAITDLGLPVSLLDLSLGVLAERGGALYLSGYDAGYAEENFPLYDPLTAGDLSPLLNAIEAAAVVSPSGCPMTDVFLSRGSLLPKEQLKKLALASVALTVPSSSPVIREALRELSWALLDVTLAAAPKPVLARMVERSESVSLNADNTRIIKAIRRTLA